jgi:hypothetical protein
MDAVAHELDIGVILVRRSMALEIIEEGGTVRQQPMDFEIAQRE